MKIIINGFHEKTFFSLVSKILKHLNVKYGHLTYAESKLTVPSEMEATFHYVKDLRIGKYNINWEEITPLEEGLMERMNGCEVVVLKMMDRLPYKLSYDERKRLYLKHLRYWNHVFEKNKIDLFLSSNVPHEVYDFIIYSLCKVKKIPTIFFFQTCISDTITMMDDWESNFAAIQVKYQELLEKYQQEDKPNILLSERFKRDFEFNTAKKDPVRFEMLRKNPSHNILATILISLNFRRFLLLLRKPNSLVRSAINHISYLNRIIKGNRVFRFYKKNTSEPDLSQKYIYFPLHMQPESSTSPMAGAYENQILIAQMIAHFLPKDVLIYVKENPYQTAVGRDLEFYKELLKISQVRLISNSFNTFALINNSVAVATATGTAGWEALYRCKPVLMFGHNFYQYAKGVFQIKSNSDCQHALNEILLNNFKPIIQDIKIFLKALESTTIEGYVDVDYEKDTHVTKSISNENILHKLKDKIKLVCSL